MAACSFDMKFVQVQASWEGSAAGSIVLQAAERSGFYIARGRCYLVDAEYANAPSYIAPFRGVRYHLREFARGNRVPRRSSLRSGIERIFGVVKSQFPILKNASHHSFDNTTKNVILCCVLHNFIRTETGGEDWIYEEYNCQPGNEFVQDDDGSSLEVDYQSAE
ncbi:hypothetical protein AAC387_Pa02g1748 [Persea americana]